MISVAPLCHHRELLIELAAARTGVLTTDGHFQLTVSNQGNVSPFYRRQHRIGWSEVNVQGRRDSNFNSGSKPKQVALKILCFKNMKRKGFFKYCIKMFM